MSLLARIKERLGVPPARLGLSEELVHAVGHRSRPGAGFCGAGADVVGRVVNSQDEWRRTRRQLNEHRAELAQASVQLYGEQFRVGRTSLITRSGWLPAAPVDLANITLTWQPGAPQSVVTGTEPEARMVCPLQAPGRQYDRYTSAIRYLDRPTLFENRPSYRLMDVQWASGTGRMAFGLATYFDKLDVSEAVGHEIARLHGQSKPSRPSLDQLPFRELVGDPFDCRRRAIVPAITTLTLRRRPDGQASFLLHWRDADKVATAGGMYDVIPAGEFQPSSVMSFDQANDFDVWRNIVREISEEFQGAPEHDGSRSTPIDYSSWSLYQALTQARNNGRVYAACLGVGLDALYPGRNGAHRPGGRRRRVRRSLRRRGAGQRGRIIRHYRFGRVAEGIPFTAKNVYRLLTHEPMASPGAACLHLAWQHRNALLGA